MPSALLTLIIFLPLVGASLVILLPEQGGPVPIQRGLDLRRARPSSSRSILWFGSTSRPAGRFQLANVRWIASLGVHYHLGVDGISLWLVLLTTFLMPIVGALARRRRSTRR